MAFCLHSSLYHLGWHCRYPYSSAPLVASTSPKQALRAHASGIGFCFFVETLSTSRVLAPSLLDPFLLHCSRVLAIFLALLSVLSRRCLLQLVLPDHPRAFCPSGSGDHLHLRLSCSSQGPLCNNESSSTTTGTITTTIRLVDNDDNATFPTLAGTSNHI